MIDLKRAVKLATECFMDVGLSKIVEAYETSEAYLFFGADTDFIVVGHFGVTVDKNTGATNCVSCNSKEMLQLLDSATEISL